MESDGLIGRIGRGDFFSVLPGGFFVLLTVGLALYLPHQTTDLIAAIRPAAEAIKDNPYYLIFVVFGAFLIGSIFRSLPVVWAERISPPFSTHFPFDNELRAAVNDITSNPGASMLHPGTVPDLSRGINKHIWNYWKDALCCRSEKAFHYYQTFEIRARYSAGLVWAGVAGVITSAAMYPKCHVVAWQMFGVSMAIYIAYSYHLRRMREVEARVLLFLFIAQQGAEKGKG